MPLTSEQYRTLTAVQRSLVQRGVDPAVAGLAILRAVDRVEPGGMGSCGPDCCCCRGAGVGQTTLAPLSTTTGGLAPAPAATTPVTGTPPIIATLDTAGDNPTVAAMRDLVGKWSWVIPVGGLLMSAKSKFTDWRASKTDPAYGASNSLRKR
jgi:hypothetical protein